MHDVYGKAENGIYEFSVVKIKLQSLLPFSKKINQITIKITNFTIKYAIFPKLIQLLQVEIHKMLAFLLDHFARHYLKRTLLSSTRLPWSDNPLLVNAMKQWLLITMVKRKNLKGSQRTLNRLTLSFVGGEKRAGERRGDKRSRVFPYLVNKYKTSGCYSRWFDSHPVFFSLCFNSFKIGLK